MSASVRLRGKHLRLPASAVLGVGGEATVFDIGRGEVAKLWHTSTPAQADKVRALLALSPALPPEVIAPTDVLVDAQQTVVGFVMPRVPVDFVPFALLFKASTTPPLPHVVRALQRLRALVEALHARGLVVGDLSDQNVVTHAGEIRLLDVDSVQIAGLPCPVGTEATLDPRLYGVDLAARPAFTPDTDAYAFAVLAFRALVHVHPYGGVHPTLTTLPERALARATVFDNEVVYPRKIARPLGVLTTALRDFFEAVFVEGKRALLPTSLLVDYERELFVCPACGLSFARSRGACPGCASALPAPRVTRGLRAHPLLDVLDVRGEIVAGALGPSGLTVVARGELGDRRLFRHESAGRGRAPLDLGSATAALVTTSGAVVVADGEIVRIFAAGEALATETTTQGFDGHPMVALSGEHVVRLCGDVALGCQVFRGTLLERTVTSALPGQTFLAEGPHPTGVLLGFTRVFRTTRFFRISGGKHVDLGVTPLRPTEVLEAARLYDDEGRTLVLRHTRERGVPLARLDLLDERGAVMVANDLRRDASPTRAGLDGRLVRGDVVLHPTDEGIVREELRHGCLGPCTTLDGTDAYVSARALLLASPRGVVSLDGRRATLLER